jgi:hypothetical protein
VSEQQVNGWTRDLMALVDLNNDGYISYYEFHSLLAHPEYRARLLLPLQRMLCTFVSLDAV